ncbi:MAG: hydroxyacid dehydrogenase [Pseudomonadota bacterium]
MTKIENDAHISILGGIDPVGIALIKKAGIAYDVVDDQDEAAVTAVLGHTDAVICRVAPFGAEHIARAPRLRVVSRHGVGYDSVDVAALTARKIPLTIVGNVNALSVAEHAFMLMIALARQIRNADRAVRENRWRIQGEVTTIELAGKTLLLLGFGRIGQRLAPRAKAFGMTVQAYDPFADETLMQKADVARVETLSPQALGAADVISVHVPYTQKTHHLIDGDFLSHMHPRSFLICTARGGIIDEAALCKALKAGGIAGAGLDVFAREPLPPDDPLRTLDSVLLTPHQASLTVECLQAMARVSAQNCLDALTGTLDPALVVNREVLA